MDFIHTLKNVFKLLVKLSNMIIERYTNWMQKLREYHQSLPEFFVWIKYLIKSIVNRLELRQLYKLVVALTVSKHKTQILFTIFHEWLKKFIEVVIDDFNFILTCETHPIINFKKIVVMERFRRVNVCIILSRFWPKVFYYVNWRVNVFFVELLNRKLLFRWWIFQSIKLDFLLSYLELKITNFLLQIFVFLQ